MARVTYTAEQKKEVIDLVRRKKMTRKEVAEKTGISAITVGKWVRDTKGGGRQSDAAATVKARPDSLAKMQDKAFYTEMDAGDIDAIISAAQAGKILVDRKVKAAIMKETAEAVKRARNAGIAVKEIQDLIKA